MCRKGAKTLFFQILVLIVLVATQFSCAPKRKLSTTDQSDQVTHTRRGEERIIRTDASDVERTEIKHRSKDVSELLQHYARIIGVPARQLKNGPLFVFIDEWMGVPHRTGGRSKAGIDCSAFTSELLRNVYKQKNVPRTAHEMSQQVKRKYENQLREGDLLFFKFGGASKVNHVGVFLGNGKFVHVSSSKGVIISRLRDRWYYPYFTRCGTLKSP
jgi:lipoprotein Spr